ncbi:nucleolar pre-ribosomal-associated protein 1 [Hetaerina americana]|uniref:nucleolar pre-ribosomal-associated protein 1 n=1 Tax=Hetaerina americana TaxID=62018 RepID=UPI003A7F3599
MKRRKLKEDNDQGGGDLQPLKKRKHFSGLIFRQKIIGEESVQALKSFLEIYRDTTSEQDIVLEYLESGGTGEEILLLLTNENKDPESVTYVFNVLECIFLRVMTALPSYLPEAEETAKCLLQSHLQSVYLLLSAKSSAESKKAVLRLLTAMSTLNGRVAKNILTYLKISNSMMYGLTRNDNPGRTLFVHFVLSFIVEGNPHVVKILLDKKDYLKSIIPGLVYDPVETVEMVLTILQKNVLENPLINKTTKMHAFNSNVLKSFFDLFNWRGPQKPQKKSRSSKSSGTPLKEVDVNQKAVVQEALYPFLCALCGSTKSGVVFFDPTLGLSGKNHNPLIYKVLEDLEKPWEHTMVAKLLAKIFTACPDLIPSTIRRMVPYLEPRLSPKWFQAMDFIGKVIDSAEPGTYLSKAGSLMPGQLLNALERILIPKGMLQTVVGAHFIDDNTVDGVALFHSEIMVRHTSVNLLNKIIKSITRFIEYDRLEQYFSSSSAANQFCQSLLDLLSKNLPKVGSILRIWKQALNDIERSKGLDAGTNSCSTEQCFTDTGHLQEILELLLAYAKLWPPLEMGAESDEMEDGWGMLSSQHFLKEIQQFEGLELMSLELLSAIGSFTLSPDQNNKEILRHLLHVYAKEDEKQSYSPWKNLILTLFLKTGLFEGNEMEACVWVHCFRIWYQERLKNNVGEEEGEGKANVLADFILQSLNELINSSEHYMKVVSELFNNAACVQGMNDGEPKSKSIHQILKDMMDSDFDHNELLICTSNGQNGGQLSCGFTVSPLLPAALSQAKNYTIESEDIDMINNYLMMVTVHILYGQSSPMPLLHLLKGKVSSHSLPKSLEKYIKSWSTQTPRHIGQLFNNGSVFTQCSDYLLDGLKSGENIPSKFEISNITIYDGLDIILLFRMIVFHVISMAQQGCLNGRTLTIAENILDWLIQHECLRDEGENLFLKKSGGKWRDLLSHCLLTAYGNPTVLELFDPLGRSGTPERLVTQFVTHFLQFSVHFPKNKNYSDEICSHFKDKFWQCICDALKDLSEQKKETKEWNQEIMDAILTSFTFNSKNLSNLLQTFKNIPAESLVELHSWNLSGPGLVFMKLMKQLCKLKMATTKITMDPEIFSAVVNHLVALEDMFESSSKNGCGNALPHLEECLLEILQIFPHLVGMVPQRLFASLISSKFSRESACKLGHFLISRNEVFSSSFIELCESNWSEVSLQFDRLVSYLSCILDVRKESIPDMILNHVYEAQREAIKNDFSSSLVLPSWILDNPQVFKLIVMQVMDDDTCFKLYNLLIANIDSGPAVPISTLEILFLVFKKIVNCSSFKLKEKPRISLVRLTLNAFVNVLRCAAKSDSDFIDEGGKSYQTDLTKFSHFLIELLEETEECNSHSGSTTNWRLLKKHSVWKDFSQSALKIGIGQNNCLILKCLERICSKVLCVGDPDAVVMYKMTILHSKFLDIMLENKTGKVEIMELLVMLIGKNSSNLSSSLAPILLSSYGATLNKSDILIIKVLKMLDHGDLNFNQFTPFLWGSVAASFYSLKRKAKTTAFSAFSVLRQPKADQVLDLLDANQVERTIIHFPINRKLQAEDSLDIVYAENNVYDPCFYLPILSHILAPENPIKIYKVVQSGALALTVISLGSSDPDVRGAAMHILARFYSHLETGRPNKEKKLWLNFVDSLRNGFALLANSKDLENVSSLQLPSVVSTFLARSSLVMADPQHVMFFPLHNYFLAKPAIDLDMVPEFFRLFNSHEMESRSYRYWILEVLRDGMKSELDFLACLNNGAFKVLLTSFCSVTSDQKSKALVLEILAAAVQTPSTAYYLVKGYGIISWIHEVIHTSVNFSSKEEPNIVIGVIHLLSNLWLAFSDENKFKLKPEGKGLVSLASTLMASYMLQLFLSLLPKLLTVQLPLADYTLYMDSLLSVTKVYSKSSQGQAGLIQMQDVNNAVLLGKKVLKNVNVCEDALEFECNVFPTSEELLSGFDDRSIVALKCLFEFILIWKQKKGKV